MQTANREVLFVCMCNELCFTIWFEQLCTTLKLLRVRVWYM